MTPAAVYLPGQLERITGWVFADEHPAAQMLGGTRCRHGPTRALLLHDAWLIDGVLYKGTAALHLHPRGRRWPRLHASSELAHAAVYCTPQGNRYFGSWFMDDCPRYELAAAEGIAVTIERPRTAHERDYERRFAMSPTRLESAYFRDLVIFDDVGQNRDRRRRFARLGRALLEGVDAAPHPGVFILRGSAGQRRVMHGEIELAERLRERRGFRVIDPMAADVATIIAACAGARVVAGIEGSALIHGVAVLPAGGAMLVLQPPNRFCGVFKHLADRDGQLFGFVVGTPTPGAFRIDADEVERTLDLLTAAAAAL